MLIAATLDNVTKMFADTGDSPKDTLPLSQTGADSTGEDSITTIVPPQPHVTQDSSILDSAVTKKPHKLNRVVVNNAFQADEKLTFKIHYGFIKAGEAIMQVKDIVYLEDYKPAYHISTTARSAKFFDVFYKVRDSVETFIDTRGFFSWKYIKHLREGGYIFDLYADYDQRNGIANVETIRYENDELTEIRNREEFQLQIPEYVLDVLCAFYYVRTQELEVGMPIYMSNHDNKKVYDLKVIIQRKERIKVDAGTFDCIMVQPVLQGEAIFKQQGKLWVWLTDDERKIPVRMKSKVAVGSITTELIKIEGVPLPLKAQVK
jgi:hypothetical protein